MFLYFAVGKSIENEDVKQDDATPELLAGAALLAFASSLYGFAAIGQCRGRSRALAMEDDRAASAQEARDEADVARRRREQKAAAWELTERAKAAARAGDCATVKAIDAQVRDLDAALHATVFVSDAAIASCLADPTAPLAPIP